MKRFKAFARKQWNKAKTVLESRMPIALEIFKDCVYKSPAYLQLAALRKCNQEGIFILGAPDKDLEKFKSSMKYHALKVTVPKEKGRAVVAIDTRCHSNTTDPRETSSRHDRAGGSTPDDWFDHFEITSRKDKEEGHTKIFEVQLGTTTTKGANFDFKVSGAGFFNAVAPSAGIGGSYSRTDSKTETFRDETSESLTKGYEINDVLKVPPKTKVKARVTTWAVTYESETLTEITIDAKAFVKVRYRTKFSRRFTGGVLIKSVKITAKELFRNELGYKCEDDLVTFQRRGVISHIGEEVEILKERSPCSLEAEMNRTLTPIQ